MKLLQIGPYPPPLGGWSFHIKVFKDYLDSIEIINEVLDIGENRKVKGRRCIDVQGPFDYFLKVSRYCIRKYRIYIHLNGNTVTGLVLTLIAQLLALLTFQKSLLSFHAGVVQECFKKGFTIQKILSFILFHLASGIICNSKAVKEQIITNFAVPPKKVYPIPCFSMQYIEHEHVLTDEEKDFLANHSPIFSSYVFFRDEYDPDTLIEALKLIKEKHPSFGAIIIGSLEGVEPYKKKIKLYNLHDNILLVGEKNHDNFLTIVENSHLVIRTPVSDGVCSSVMEALAIKVPVVGSNNNTRPQEVILFKPGNAADLASNVIETLRNLDQIKDNLAGIVRHDAIKEELDFLLQFSYNYCE